MVKRILVATGQAAPAKKSTKRAPAKKATRAKKASPAKKAAPRRLTVVNGSAPTKSSGKVSKRP